MTTTSSKKNLAQEALSSYFGRIELPIVEWNSDGIIIYANRHFSELTQTDIAKLPGMHFYSSYFPGSLIDQWDQARLNFVQSKALANFATLLRDAHGNCRTVLWTTVLKTGDAGKLLGVVGFCIEISALMKATSAVAELADTLKEVYGFIAPKQERGNTLRIG